MVEGLEWRTFSTVKLLLLVVIWPFFLCSFNFSYNKWHCIQFLQIRVWSGRNNATSDNWVLAIFLCQPVYMHSNTYCLMFRILFKYERMRNIRRLVNGLMQRSCTASCMVRVRPHACRLTVSCIIYVDGLMHFSCKASCTFTWRPLCKLYPQYMYINMYFFI